jgi:outer membrane scaffolding protein for murein synthesis (MipA/OmpV family)
MNPARHAGSSVVLCRFATASLLACLPSLAAAELSNDTLLGPGLRSRPAYDGSASQHTELVPVVRYLGAPWFIRSTQGVFEGGLRAELASGLHVGTQLAYESGRRASESDFLAQHGLADIARGVSLGAQLEWDQHLGPVPVTLLARARRHAHSELGAQFDLRLSAGILQSGPLAAGVFAQASAANAKSARAMYSVTPQQAASGGLPAFDAAGGWLYGSVGLLGSLDLATHWAMVGSLESRRLRGSAASSPLTERVNNHYASLGLAYRY